MDSSLTLLSANIQFLDTQLALIHIPLHLYASFLQPILNLLLPAQPRPASSSSASSSSASSSQLPPSDHPFVNISVTPIECSIACSRTLASLLFVPAIDALDPASRSQIHITHDDFIVMQVDGEGLDAGQRVLELTSPLAMAGISIFFITTYFSDYILVPLRCRGHVVLALEERGFQFEQQTSSYVNPSHNRNPSSSVSSTDPSHPPPPPGTPPPATVSELQTRTFATLKRRNIVPTVDSHIRLIQCAGTRDPSRSNGSSHARGSSSGGSSSHLDDPLYLGLVRCLITTPHPPFLSLTLTDTEPASLLLSETLVANFAPNALLGATNTDCLIPITLDLRDLPLESTGIVCGVAGRLVGGTSTPAGSGGVEMSYLSTARAGTVMVGEDELDRAIQALQGEQVALVNGDG